MGASTGTSPVLGCRLDAEQGGLDRRLRCLGRSDLDERASGAFERAIVGHAERPSGRRCARPDGLEDLPEGGDGVVEPRSGGPGRDPEELGDLDEGQPEVVVQHEDRALLDRQPAESPLQFIAVGQDGAAIRGRRTVERQPRTWAVHGRARRDSS